MSNTKNCGGCGRTFESKLDNNFCQSCIDADREDSAFNMCPRCDHEYDDIDRDYHICSRCGYNAETQSHQLVITHPDRKKK